jgi:hypothetical protein
MRPRRIARAATCVHRGLMTSVTFLFVSAAHLATLFLVHPCGL